MKRLAIFACAAACLTAGCGDPTGDKSPEIRRQEAVGDMLKDGRIASACDGKNLVYRDNWSHGIAVSPRDPRCAGK